MAFLWDAITFVPRTAWSFTGYLVRKVDPTNVYFSVPLGETEQQIKVRQLVENMAPNRNNNNDCGAGHVAILGSPNVGKSALANLISQVVENIPDIAAVGAATTTRTIQRHSIQFERSVAFHLVETPGIDWRCLGAGNDNKHAGNNRYHALLKQLLEGLKFSSAKTTYTVFTNSRTKDLCDFTAENRTNPLFGNTERDNAPRLVIVVVSLCKLSNDESEPLFKPATNGDRGCYQIAVPEKVSFLLRALIKLTEDRDYCHTQLCLVVTGADHLVYPQYFGKRGEDRKMTYAKSESDVKKLIDKELREECEICLGTNRIHFVRCPTESHPALTLAESERVIPLLVTISTTCRRR